jgi:hypothetical protein
VAAAKDKSKENKALDEKQTENEHTPDKPSEIKPEGDKKTYLVLTPLRHDGTFYAVDSDIKLSDHDAGPLLAVNAIGSKPAEEEVDNG